MAFCKVLGCTVVLPPFFNHYSVGQSSAAAEGEGSTEGQPGRRLREGRTAEPALYAFSDVFDEGSLSPLVKTASLEQLRGLGWDGRLSDLIVFSGRRRAAYVRRMEAATNISAAHAAVTTLKTPFPCSPTDLGALRKLLKPGRVAGLQVRALPQPPAPLLSAALIPLTPSGPSTRRCLAQILAACCALRRPLASLGTLMAAADRGLQLLLLLWLLLWLLKCTAAPFLPAPRCTTTCIRKPPSGRPTLWVQGP